MFIRRSTYRLKPEFDTEDGQAEFEREMRANVRPGEIEGLLSTAHVPNDDGSWTVVAVWETKIDAMSAIARIDDEWERQSYKLAAPPQVETAGISIWEGG